MRTILEKIDASAVVIADVTLVGQTLFPDTANASETKKLINSNVAIELGYAFHALTDRRVLMVFNAHYGCHEELPFDLRHPGGALVFDLAADASRESLDNQGKQLTAKLVAALKLCLPTPRVDSAPFPETLTIASRAAYFRPGEELASVGEPDSDEVKFAYAPVGLCYLRLIPTRRRDQPIPLARLVQAAPRLPLLSRQRGQIVSRPNRYGAIGFEPALFAQRSGKINASTQLFQNGELWSINASLIAHERGGRPAGVPLPFVAAVVLEQVYYDTLRGLVQSASELLELELPWQVECGLVGIEGLHICVPPDEFRTVLKPEVAVRRVLKDAGASGIDSLLLTFFEALYDATGYARPGACQWLWNNWVHEFREQSMVMMG